MESAGSLVVQLTVAEFSWMLVTVTLVIIGGVVSARANVVNVKSPDVARLPAASRDLTR